MSKRAQQKPLPTSLQSDFIPSEIMDALAPRHTAPTDLGPPDRYRRLPGRAASVWNFPQRRDRLKHLTHNAACVCGAGKWVLKNSKIKDSTNFVLSYAYSIQNLRFHIFFTDGFALMNVSSIFKSLRTVLDVNNHPSTCCPNEEGRCLTCVERMNNSLHANLSGKTFSINYESQMFKAGLCAETELDSEISS